MVSTSQKTTSTVDTAELRSAFPATFPPSDEIENISRLAGDVSARSYYRIAVKNKSSSYVLQTSESFPAEQLTRHPFLSILKQLGEWGVSVPTLKGVSAERGWILLEDLSDEMLQHSKTLELYKATIDQMVIWTVKSCSSKADLPHFKQAFDFEKLNWEMNFTATHFIEGLLGLDAKPFLAAVAPTLHFLEERPRFLAHRDYHSRNVMLSKGQVYVIDFQDARMGPITYDIVSLLWDPYVRLSESWQKELLEYWRTSLLKIGASESHVREALSETLAPVKWQEELERMKVQRLLKAAGTYASFFRLKNRKDYLPVIRPALGDVCVALERIQKLGAASDVDDKLLAFLKSLNLKPVDILI